MTPVDTVVRVRTGSGVPTRCECDEPATGAEPVTPDVRAGPRAGPRPCCSTQARGRRRLGPAALRTALVDLHDFWLSSHAAAIGLTDRAALVAVGALGRRELAPYSDLDLVLLHDGRKDIDRLAEQLWYPLWDAGIGLDHSVRTPGQAVQVAATDLRAALGLLEARHIAGDEALSDTVPRRRAAGVAGRASAAGSTSSPTPPATAGPRSARSPTGSSRT